MAYLSGGKVTIAVSTGDGHWFEVPAYCSYVEISESRRGYRDTYLDDGLYDFIAVRNECEVTAHFVGDGEFMHYFDADFLSKMAEEREAPRFIICPYCGLSNSPDADYCGKDSTHGCGGSLAA